MLRFMSCLAFLFDIVDMHCSVDRQRFLLPSGVQRCTLQESTTNIGAGVARNVSVKCGYNKDIGFHYKISWAPPKPTGTPVSRYRLKIRFEYQPGERACFWLPSSQHKFLLNQSMGMLYGCMMSFWITPEPIHRVDGTLFRSGDLVQAYGCPIPPKLLPLPNAVVNAGSNFSFVASFEEDPFPVASIVWYFSSDRVHCRNPKIIAGNLTDTVLTKNNSLLTISKVGKQHAGCFVVFAKNSVGHTSEQRGYLTFIPQKVTFKQPPSNGYFEGPFFASLAALMILAVVVLMFVMYRRKK